MCDQTSDPSQHDLPRPRPCATEGCGRNTVREDDPRALHRFCRECASILIVQGRRAERISRHG